MKGLFNYETAYRQYTRQCLEDFMRDNIQYAEIRPTFMKSNRLYKDDGTARIDNRGIMSIIIEEVTRFQHDVASKGGYFGGLKVIYTAPRSMSPEEVRQSLEECLRFKQEWPQWIAGRNTPYTKATLAMRFLDQDPFFVLTDTLKSLQDTIWWGRKAKDGHSRIS